MGRINERKNNKSKKCPQQQQWVHTIIRTIGYKLDWEYGTKNKIK